MRCREVNEVAPLFCMLRAFERIVPAGAKNAHFRAGDAWPGRGKSLSASRIGRSRRSSRFSGAVSDEPAVCRRANSARAQHIERARRDGGVLEGGARREFPFPGTTAGRRERRIIHRVLVQKQIFNFQRLFGPRRVCIQEALGITEPRRVAVIFQPRY